MKPYESIETIWKRDPITHALNLGDLRIDAAGIVNAWSITEKVDGMNIRVIWTMLDGKLQREIRGRTDNAVPPPGVEFAVDYNFPNPRAIYEVWKKEFDAGQSVTFYGEAFGPKIQKNPLRTNGIFFRVFDVLIGTGTRWLDDADVQHMAHHLGYRAVPHLGLYDSLPVHKEDLDALFASAQGPVSRIATEPLRPEGVVARPVIPLFDKFGNRVMWKLTYREFDKLAAQAKDIAGRIEPVDTMQADANAAFGLALEHYVSPSPQELKALSDGLSLVNTGQGL